MTAHDSRTFPLDSGNAVERRRLNPRTGADVGSITDKLLQFFNGASLSGVGDFLTARPSAEDVSGFLNTPSPIPSDLIPLPPNIGADIFDFFAGTGRETPPPPEPPVAESRPQSIPDALGGRSAGAPGGGVSFRSPFINAPSGPGVPLPDIPDPQDLLTRLEALGPTSPTEVNALPFIMKGLAAGAGKDQVNVGDLLLNAGLGALSGRAEASFEQGRVNRESEAANRDFQIALANAEAGARGEFFDRSTAQTSERQRRKERGSELKIAEQQQLVPSIKDGFLLQPKREGDQVETSVKNLRPKEGAGSITALRIAYGVAVAQANPSVAYSALQSIDPGVVDSMADALGIVRGTGIEPSLGQKKQIVQEIAKVRPDLMDQVAGISQLLGTLSGLGGKIPKGF